MSLRLIGKMDFLFNRLKTLLSYPQFGKYKPCLREYRDYIGSWEELLYWSENSPLLLESDDIAEYMRLKGWFLDIVYKTITTSDAISVEHYLGLLERNKISVLTKLMNGLIRSEMRLKRYREELDIRDRSTQKHVDSVSSYVESLNGQKQDWWQNDEGY